MTIEISLKCDAYGCCNSREIYDYTDSYVKHAGWFNDPITDGQHYCPSCWPEVKKEFEENPT